MNWIKQLTCPKEWGTCPKGGKHKCGRSKVHKQTTDDKRHWCQKCNDRKD